MNEGVVVDGVLFNSRREAVAIINPDRARQAENERAGHSLCSRCNGTGNELYAMYRACEECGGNGIAEEYGNCSPLDRWYFRSRERLRRWRINRRYRSPRDWNAEVRCWLSYWTGRGNWLHDRRDSCIRCEALPSDVDFEMRRVGPRKVECTWDCEEDRP